MVSNNGINDINLDEKTEVSNFLIKPNSYYFFNDDNICQGK